MHRDRHSGFALPFLWALSASICAAVMCLTQAAAAETAAQAAMEPVQPPKPYRLPDGHLNWTGFWVPLHGMLENDIGLGGTPERAKSPSGSGFRRPFSGYPELKSPYKELLAKFKQDAAAGKAVDSLAACYPPGMPGMMIMIYGMELLQTPQEIAITSEFQAASRRIWLHQKTHTDPDELDPTYVGESIAHWQGDKLIVDTVGVRKDVSINNFGVMHSDKMHLVETFSETKPGILEDVISIEDPDAFSAPWTETETYRYRPDLRIKEYVCLENNRNVGPQGGAVFKN